MNRLVLIGNGFDLSHGLKTKYEDFIYWYWKGVVAHMLTKSIDTYEDVLCKVTNHKLDYWGKYYLFHSEEKEIYDFLVNNDGDIEIEYSPLFERINKSVQTKGWVDIENEYYSLLTDWRMDINKGYVLPDYKLLNNQLDILRNKLIEYLRLETNKITNVKENIREILNLPIDKKEMAVSSEYYNDMKHNEKIYTAKTMLLSFNYTYLPQLYESNAMYIKTNYIHGRLDNPESVIFGYGDELDERYKKLNNQNNNEALRHIKSIRYLESDNYRKMLEFIESAPFQVCIMGHSCGNSDRTLLNTLFEHKNCISIKPYFYKKQDGTDTYLELVQNISRNFTDMKLMRDRVVNKEYCEPFSDDSKKKTD